MRRLLLAPLLVITLALVTLALVTMPARTQAEPEAPTVMLVVDGSGSMWGKIEGERLAKIYMVREGLRAALPKAKSVRIGMVAFGLRSGGCNDIEIVALPEADSMDNIMGPLEKPNPRGRGPVARSLSDAATELSQFKGARSIIMIIDEADNCQVDACEVARGLKENEPGLKVHVIGLGMKREDVQRMQCVPRETGGRLIEVASLASLTAALDELLALAGQAGPSPSAATGAAATKAAPAAASVTPSPGKGAAPLPAAAVAPKTPGLHLSAKLTPGGERIGVPIRWRVRREGGDQTGPADFEAEAPTATAVLPEGRYMVEAETGLVSVRLPVAVAAGAAIDQSVVLNAGLIRIKAATARTGTLSRNMLVVVQSAAASAGGTAAQPLHMYTGADSTIAVPPGSYAVTLHDGQVRQRREVSIVAGSVQAVDLVLGTGLLKLSLGLRESGPVIENVLFVVYEDDPDAPQGRREVTRTVATTTELTLPAGTYYIAARQGLAAVRERVALKAGQTIERRLVGGAAQLTLSTAVAGLPKVPDGLISYRIERLEGAPTDVVVTSRTRPTLELAPGRYRIEGRFGLLNARAIREVEVRAGQAQAITIEHRAGLARLRLLDKPDGLAFVDVFWEIRDQQGQLIWATGNPQPVAPLSAGRYTVRGEHRDRKGEAVIEVRSGEDRSFDVVAK